MALVVFLWVVGGIGVVIWLATAYITYLIRHSRSEAYAARDRQGAVRLCCVLGSGGHTTEMLHLLESMAERYPHREYVIADTDRMSEIKVLDFEARMTAQRGEGKAAFYQISRIPRSREVGQSYVTSVATTLRALVACAGTVWRISPDLLLVNGPGTCIPVCVCAAIYDMLRLRDTAIVFVESLCRVEKLSLSGAILYFSGFADDVVVQWPELKQKYPRVVTIEEL